MVERTAPGEWSPGDVPSDNDPTKQVPSRPDTCVFLNIAILRQQVILMKQSRSQRHRPEHAERKDRDGTS
jgi:hypothetical protein